MKQYYYYVMENILKLFHRDPMKYKIARYKYYGAKIGTNVRTFSPISSAESYLISIGNNVTISSGVKFITHDNSIIKFSNQATDLIGKITIGNNCFIGANSIILPGVFIGDNCIIGAGSVVTSSIPNGSIMGGNPAKIIGNVKEFAEKNRNMSFNFTGKSFLERRIEISLHEERMIKRKLAKR